MSANEDDEFYPFLAEDVRNNPKQYAQLYFNAAKHSASPHHALNERHQVKTVGVNKATSGPLHESLTVGAHDEDTQKNHFFVIDRTASTRSVKQEEKIAYCIRFPDSQTIIDAIQTALQDMTTSVQSSSEGQPSSSSSDSRPLLPDAFTNDDASKLARALSWAKAQARSSAQSSLVELEAEDTISGVKKPLGKCVRQYDPVGLTLFHTALLANVVHTLALTYVLFESQCYWFVNVMFDVIVALYPSATKQVPPSAESPRILLPKDAGRWGGVIINDPRVVAAVVSVAKSRFEQEKQKYEAKLIEASLSRIQHEQNE